MEPLSSYKPESQTKSFWASFSKKISRFTRIFTDIFSSSTEIKKPKHKKTPPPIVKVNGFTEASKTLDYINTILNTKKDQPFTPSKARNPINIPSAPKMDLTNYKAVNPIVLKSYPEFSISIVHGDLFESNADVIVNAAKLGFGRGGGIDGAIQCAGGDDYVKRHQALDKEYPKFKEGDAVIVEKVALTSRRRDPKTRISTQETFTTEKDVIVVAGPNRQLYLNNDKTLIVEDNKKLYNCYYNSLVLAHSKGKTSIAFPAISVGIFNYPKDEAALQSLQAIRNFINNYPDTQLKSIAIHYFDPSSLNKEEELKTWYTYRDVVNNNPEYFNSIPVFEKKSVTSPVKPNVHSLGEINRRRQSEKFAVIVDLKRLSESLKTNLKNKEVPGPRKHLNLSNTCYMNSALQSLSHAYVHQNSLSELLNTDLTLGEEEPLQSLEKRLASWSPIHQTTETKEELTNRAEELKEAINLNPGVESNSLRYQYFLIQDKIAYLNEILYQKKSLEECKQQINVGNSNITTIEDNIIHIQQKLELRHDKILFKWSFLLYMQACKYGTDMQVTEALKAHHRVCFAIARHVDFKSMPSDSTIKESHDIGSYLELWHSMLELNLNGFEFKQYEQNGETKINNFQRKSEGIVNLSVSGENKNFLSALERTFSNHVKEQPEADVKEFTEIMKFQGSPPSVINFRLQRSGISSDGTLSKGFPYADGQPYDKSILNLDSYFDEKEMDTNKARYQLVSFTVHKSNNSGGGHYISYVLRREEDKYHWYECDDNKIVKKVVGVPFENACTLTYVRVNASS